QVGQRHNGVDPRVQQALVGDVGYRREAFAYPGSGFIVDGVTEDALVACDQRDKCVLGEQAVLGDAVGTPTERSHRDPHRVAVAADDGAGPVVALYQRHPGVAESAGADRVRQLVDTCRLDLDQRVPRLPLGHQHVGDLHYRFRTDATGDQCPHALGQIVLVCVRGTHWSRYRFASASRAASSSRSTSLLTPGVRARIGTSNSPMANKKSRRHVVPRLFFMPIIRQTIKTVFLIDLNRQLLPPLRPCIPVMPRRLRESLHGQRLLIPLKAVARFGRNGHHPPQHQSLQPTDRGRDVDDRLFSFWPPGYFPSPLIGSSTLQSFTNIAISIPHRVLYGLYPQGYILIKVQSNKQDGNMCRPVQCKVCSKTTWAGCGNHIAEVKASVPKDQWCPGNHSQTEIANAQAFQPGFLSRLFSRS